MEKQVIELEAVPYQWFVQGTASNYRIVNNAVARQKPRDHQLTDYERACSNIGYNKVFVNERGAVTAVLNSTNWVINDIDYQISMFAQIGYATGFKSLAEALHILQLFVNGVDEESLETLNLITEVTKRDGTNH